MIKFFRRIRKNLVSQNRIVKYFLYAFGEIILVVIGILIALQINNWNEFQKLKRNEKDILNNILTAINNDLGVYNNLFEYRLERKRQAIDTLVHFVGLNAKIHDSIVIKYFEYVGHDIVARVDSGPFDALKSGGLHQITNEALREQIVSTYQVLLPSFVIFTQIPSNELNPIISELELKLIEPKVVLDQNNKFSIKKHIIAKNIFSNPDFIRVLDLQKRKYDNYKSRLSPMRKILESLKKEIEKELQND